MFGGAYFGRSYFGGRYYGSGSNTAAPGASAAAIWAYVLSNGKSAGQNLVEINEAVLELLTRSCFDDQIQAGYTAGDVLRILAAVAAGKTAISDLGGGAAQVTFRAIDDSGDVVVADMQNSERVDVTLTPVETS